MSKTKNNLSKTSLEATKIDTRNTADFLKKAWKDLPSDFTFGERSLFIELAARLVKIDNSRDTVN